MYSFLEKLVTAARGGDAVLLLGRAMHPDAFLRLQTPPLSLSEYHAIRVIHAFQGFIETIDIAELFEVVMQYVEKEGHDIPEDSFFYRLKATSPLQACAARHILGVRSTLDDKEQLLHILGQTQNTNISVLRAFVQAK
jgi:hypothetical protein